MLISNFSIDSTAETEFYGRLINHSRRIPNCESELLSINSSPVMIIKAKRDINPGEIISHKFVMHLK